MTRAFTVVAGVCVLLGSLAIGVPAAVAQTMQVDPNLPLPAVSTMVATDGTATVTLESPAADDVCVWGIQWGTEDTLEYGSAVGLRPGGQPPQGGTVPPVCGTGTLSTSITLSPAQVGPVATSIRVLWSPISNVWTHSAYTTLPWPLSPDAPGSAPEVSLSWSPAGDLRAAATTAKPCHWRFEYRLGYGSWVGAWVGGSPGEPCEGTASTMWDVPEDLWASAGQVRAAYTATESSTTLSEWATVDYAYAMFSAPALSVANQQVSIDGVPSFACRVAVSWYVEGQWTDGAPSPASGCGLPGISGNAPIAFADAPDGAVKLRIAYQSLPAAYSTGAWSVGISLSGLLQAEDPLAIEQPDGSVMVTFTDPNPSGDVCVWRWELRRSGAKNVFGAGSTPLSPTKKSSCTGQVSIPASLDDPSNLDLVMWPDADGTNDQAAEAPEVYVSLPDVSLSDPVATGKADKPTLKVQWWTSPEITRSVPRAEIWAPGKKGLCSYRLEWTAAGVAPRGIWTTGPCSGVLIELPQLDLGWSSAWKIRGAWASSAAGEKAKKYSAFASRTWDTANIDTATASVFATNGEVKWYAPSPPNEACNAQVQTLTTTDPTTWQVISDTYVAPLGLCNDLWTGHTVQTANAAAIRIRMTASTSSQPVGSWQYAALTPPKVPSDAVIRWNDAGTPVVIFTDPSPIDSVCFWQVRVATRVINDVTVQPDGSTTCSSATTFTLNGDIDWSKVTGVEIAGSEIPQITAVGAWDLASWTAVPYSPRIAAGKGPAPVAALHIDQSGYPEVHVTGNSCRYVAAWRPLNESLWRIEPLSSSAACANVLRLNSAGPTSQPIEVRAAAATVAGPVATVGDWSATVATTDPLPTPQVALFPNSYRVRVQNQPASVCGTVFEVRRSGALLSSGLIRAKDATGSLECGPWAVETTMIPTSSSGWPLTVGDEVRFAFAQGLGSSQIVGPWSTWVAFPTTDSDDPTIAIAYPVNGSNVSGEVSSAVTATDNLGVERVEIRSGTRLLGMALIPASADTWTIPWDSWALPNGPITYIATAFDTSGNSASVEGRVFIENPPAVQKVSAKNVDPVVVTVALPSKATKAPSVNVPRGSAVRLRVKDKAFSKAAVYVRIGMVWESFGAADSKGWLPAWRVNGPGPYLVRLLPTQGNAGYLVMAPG